MAPGSNSGGETATTIRMANVGNDFYLTNNYYNWGTNRFDATNEGQAFFKMGEDGRFSFGGRSSATTDSPSYNAGIGYDGSISAGTSMTMVNGTGKLNVWGNSDTSDEDVELRLYDNDTDAGSAIPTIAFYKGSGTGPVRFADIRANDVLGIIMRDGSGNSLFSVGLDGNVLVGQTSAGTNGKLQVTGGIGLAGTAVIRLQSNADDSSSLKFWGNQFVAGTNNSHSYGYSGGGQIASVSPTAGKITLDVGAVNTQTLSGCLCCKQGWVCEVY